MKRHHALAVLLVAVLLAPTAAEVKQAKVPANRLFEIRPTQPSAILVQEPLGLDYRTYLLADGAQVFVFHAGARSRIVLTLFHNGDPFPVLTQHVIEIESPPQPEPNPPRPDPDAPLTGFAAEVQRRAREVNLDLQQAKRLGMNFDTVASMAAAGGFATVQAAMSKVAEYNARQWPRSAAPLVSWLEAELPQRITTLDDLAQVFRHIAQGLVGINR